MRRIGLPWVFCFLCILLGEPGFCFDQFSHQAWVATGPGTVTCEYLPGRASNSLRLMPVRDQKFVVASLQGFPCLFQTVQTSDGDSSWGFDVPDHLWNAQFGDALLAVDFIASHDYFLNWMAFDSAFHEYHRIGEGSFSIFLAFDRGISQTWQDIVRHGSNRFTAIFRLQKAWFGNRSSAGTDFLLNPISGQGVGVARITLSIQPVQMPRPAEPVDVTSLTREIFRRWFRRLPKPAEERLIRDSFARGERGFPNLFLRLMQTPEFRDRHFRPYPRVPMIRHLFRLLLGRDPIDREMDSLCENFDCDRNDTGLIHLSEKFTFLALERMMEGMRRAAGAR